MDAITYHLAANTPKDIDVLIDYRILFAKDLLGELSPEDEAAQRESLRQYFTKETGGNYICWYAAINGEVAAIAGMVIRYGPGNMKNPSGTWGYIMNVYTMPQHRRKGLSGILLDMLTATGAERGITAFELHATQAGEPVYIKSGFKLHPEPTYRKFL